MADTRTLKRRKNDGTWEDIYIETDSALVNRPSGVTVEKDLVDHLPAVSQNVPTFLTSGKLTSVGSDLYMGDASGNATKINTTVDTALSSTSINAVQNKVIKAALDKKLDYVAGGKQGQILTKTTNGVTWGTVSQTVTDGETSPVSSDAVYTALADIAVSKLTEMNAKIPTYFWIGTKAQYDALTKYYMVNPNDTVYITTDEDSDGVSLAGVTLNGNTITPINGVVNINALTGVKLNSTTIAPVNGVVNISAIKGVQLNGAVSHVADGNAIIEAVTGVSLNGNIIQLTDGNADISAITGINLNGTAISITDGIAKILIDVPVNYLKGATLNDNTITPINGVVNINALTGVTLNGADVPVTKGVATITVSAVTGLKLNNSAATVTNGVINISALTGLSLNGATVTPSNGVVAVNAVKSMTYNGDAVPVTNGAAAISAPAILYGTTDPDASLGKNGDVYIKLES